MIAWSRAGTIASISPDGKSVEFRFLRCHPQNGSWQLSEPTTCDIVSGSDSAPLVHLAWAPNLTPELAIIDSVGRVIFISFPFTLNRPFLSRKWEGEPNDLHAVVGCYWLNLSPHGRQVSWRSGRSTGS
jgi:mediator of RNA polymerase II transcription subunit 16